MGLLDEIVAEATPPSRCRIQELLQTLPSVDAAGLEQAMSETDASGNLRYTHSVISRVLARHKLYSDPKVIGRHRRGECTCQSSMT